MLLRFEWDLKKAESNFRKHGIHFVDAVTAFDDPNAIAVQDRFEGGEDRWQLLGLSDDVLLVLVAYTEREGEDENGEPCEIMRIISARSADRAERRRYHGHGGPIRARYT